MRFLCILRGTVIACLITAAALAASAALVFFGAIGEGAAAVAAFFCMAAAVFFGAMHSAKRAASSVLMNALAVSALCSLVMTAAAYLVCGGLSLDIRTVSVIAALFCAGFIGAVFASRSA